MNFANCFEALVLRQISFSRCLLVIFGNIQFGPPRISLRLGLRRPALNLAKNSCAFIGKNLFDGVLVRIYLIGPRFIGVQVLTILLFMHLISCSTSQLSKFEKIKIGDDKNLVLDHLGSPNNSKFQNGEYIWIYRIFDGGNKFEKEIRLKENVVVLKGEVVRPHVLPFLEIKLGMKQDVVLDVLGFPKSVEKSSEGEFWVYDGAPSRRLGFVGGSLTSVKDFKTQPQMKEAPKEVVESLDEEVGAEIDKKGYTPIEE